jgi:hypothetical protein
MLAGKIFRGGWPKPRFNAPAASIPAVKRVDHSDRALPKAAWRSRVEKD